MILKPVEILVAAALATSPAVAAAPPDPAVDPALLVGLEARMIGPFRGGRSTAIAGVESHPFTFYLGTTGGGVWKTENAGATWENVSDGHFGSSSVGAVAVAPSDPNVVYVGTGSACPRGNVMLGDGLYRSTDAGRSWDRAGLEKAGTIGRIRVDPRDPDRLWVAVLGDVFAPSQERGVYRSEDGGRSWERVLFVSSGAGAVDLALNRENPRELWAAIWRVERKPWTLIDGGEESGLYRSRDGGDSWERLSEGLPEGPLGRIGVAVSPARPERVWALITADPDSGGLYRSDDGGESWEIVSRDRELLVRGWYYAHVVAHPTDPETVFVLSVRFWRSVDGGVDWHRIDTPHGDNHDLWIHPTRPEIMAEANDGGGTVSLDGGGTWSSIHTQPTAEIYRLTVDDGFPPLLFGAQQDNTAIGVPVWSEGGNEAVQDWVEIGGGESGHVAVHPRIRELTWAGNYIGTIVRNDRRTGERLNVILYPELADGIPPRDLTYRFQWNAPILVSEHPPHALYHASHRLHRSLDRGTTWETISPDLSYDDESKQELPGGPVQHDDTGVEVYGTIFALAESPHSRGELWAGTDDGRVQLSRDDGGTWTEVTPPDLEPDTTVNAIDLSTHAPGRAWIAGHRYRLGDPRPWAWRTDDWGATWVRIGGPGSGLPQDAPLRVVREDPQRRDLLFAGHERGLSVSFDGGERWQPLEAGLPVVQVADLVVHGDVLALATHGRSFWVLDDLTPVRQAPEVLPGRAVQLYAPLPTPRVRTGAFDDGPQPDTRPTGVAVSLYLERVPEREGALHVLDGDGETLRSYRLLPATPEESEDDDVVLREGLQQVVWDLRTEEADVLDDAVMSLGYTGGLTVPPGSYRVRLELPGESLERPIEVLPDPRLEGVTDADYAAGYELAREVRDRLEAIHGAVRALRSLRGQTEGLAERLEAARLELDLDERLTALDEAVDTLEDELIQRLNEAGQDPLNFPPRLDNQYAHLYGLLAGVPGRPTEGARLRLRDLDARWEPLRQRLRDLLAGPVAELNRLLDEAEVPTILPPALP